MKNLPLMGTSDWRNPRFDSDGAPYPLLTPCLNCQEKYPWGELGDCPFCGFDKNEKGKTLCYTCDEIFDENAPGAETQSGETLCPECVRAEQIEELKENGEWCYNHDRSLRGDGESLYCPDCRKIPTIDAYSELGDLYSDI